MTTTNDLKREALERAQTQIGDMLPDCVMFHRGEYAGFDVETATKSVAAFELRARADEADKHMPRQCDMCAVYFVPNEHGYHNGYRCPKAYRKAYLDELRAAANEIEKGE